VTPVVFVFAIAIGKIPMKGRTRVRLVALL
jgi:hypothetical protein